uniref:WEB family protein n=1 Tax=Noccaea caerulescens TaxID=107243 RepID=A0A1J3H502_NOCCA
MGTFHSVKDAVKLFNAGFSGGGHLNQRQEQIGVLVEETNISFWKKEVNKLKEKINNAEAAKIEALLELEEATKTVEHLNHELIIRQNMNIDDKSLDLSTSVRAVASELGLAKQYETELGIRQNMRNAEKGLDLSSNARVVTSELGVAKESLHRVAEEESELCVLMESLKLELQNVKKEHSQLKEIEQRQRDQAVEELNKETQVAKNELLLLEEELKIALLEAQEAKASEEHARQRLNVAETLVLQSEMKETGAAELSEVKETGAAELSEVKETGATELSETEALRACRDETLKKLAMSEREIEDIKAATQEALKKAEMAEEATVVVDAELKRRRKAASRVLAESKMCAKSLPSSKEVHKPKPRSASKDGCLVKC